MPFTLSFPFLEPQPVVAVHAGLVPGVPLEQQLRKHMTTMRNLQLMAAPAATEGGWRCGGGGKGGGEGGGGGAGRPRLVALERSGNVPESSVLPCKSSATRLAIPLRSAESVPESRGLVWRAR